MRQGAVRRILDINGTAERRPDRRHFGDDFGDPSFFDISDGDAWQFGDLNDTITANPAAAAYIDGRAGNDLIYGGPLGDVLVGGLGNDTINAGDGNDALYGDGLGMG